MISYAFWKQRFGLNPSALGQTIQIHDKAFEIVGVTPPGFFGETVGEAPDIWVPMMMQQAIYSGKDYLSSFHSGNSEPIHVAAGNWAAKAGRHV